MEIIGQRDSLSGYGRDSDLPIDRMQRKREQLDLKRRVVEHKKKERLFKSWLKIMRFKLLLKVHGMQIFQRFNRLD